MDLEEEEELEEVTTEYERGWCSLDNSDPPPYCPQKGQLTGIPSTPVASGTFFIKPSTWSRLASAFPVFEDPAMQNRYHEPVGYKQLKDLAESVRTYGVSASFTLALMERLAQNAMKTFIIVLSLMAIRTIIAKKMTLWAVTRTWPIPMPVHANSSALPVVFFYILRYGCALHDSYWR